MLWIFTAFLIECVSNTFSQAVIYVFMFWFIYSAFHSTVLFCFVKFLCRPICHTFLFFFLTSGFATKLGKAPRYRYRDTKIKTEAYDVCLLPGLTTLYVRLSVTCVREG